MFKMSWTQKDGTQIRNQYYTADAISGRLMALEKEEATDIKVEQVQAEDIDTVSERR